MKKRTQALSTVESDLLVDVTFHRVPASLLTEFAEEIVRPYFGGNMNAAMQDLILKALAEEEFVRSRIAHVRSSVEE